MVGFQKPKNVLKPDVLGYGHPHIELFVPLGFQQASTRHRRPIPPRMKIDN
jgi:hypothetical protein